MSTRGSIINTSALYGNLTSSVRTISNASVQFFGRDSICGYHGILSVFETGIREHHPLYSVGDAERGKINARKVIRESMHKAEGDEEALVIESYEAFIKIKEEPDPGNFPLIFSLVFMILIPIFSFEDAFSGDGTLCFGSMIFGFALLIVGAILSSAQTGRYKKATRDLANTAGIPEKIAYPFFSFQATDKRINSLVLQKYPFLSESKENSSQTKPRRIVLSQREEE